jgi:TetR/AcrR family transcriptional repressor of nem operon
MAVFWGRGVHRTNVDDLLAATGLARSSLYNSFGGKQALFDQAIKRYVEQQVGQLKKMFYGRSLKEGLEILFDRAVEDNYREKGCLLVNSAGGLMLDEPREQKMLRQGFEEIFSVLEEQVRAAQQNKELGEHLAEQRPEDIVAMICSTLSGLRIFHKTGMPKARLKNAANLTLVGMFPK